MNICRSVCFSTSVQQTERVPGDHIYWRNCLYSLRCPDYTLSVVSKSTKLTEFIEFSTWQSRFFNTFYSTFSNLWNLHFTPADLLWLSDNMWRYIKKHCNKTHPRYYSTYDSRYDINCIFCSQTSNVFRIVRYKNITVCREVQWKSLGRNSVSLSCICFGI